MPRKKIHIDRETLAHLYLQERMSPAKIGVELGCSFSTVTNRLKEFGIPLRTPAAARLRYEKIPFTGTLAEKAYMLGLAIGDLNIYRPSENGVTLVARCHSTQEVQLAIFTHCFKKYGKITVSRAGKHIHMAAYLDAASFDFLLDKSCVPSWVEGETRLAFIAGYNDAEGNFILNQGRGRMKIDSYDYRILRWIWEELTFEGISCKLRRIADEGDFQSQTMKYAKDLWRLNVNEAASLEKTIKLLLPYTHHEKRKGDMEACLRNIHQRRLVGTI